MVACLQRRLSAKPLLALDGGAHGLSAPEGGDETNEAIPDVEEGSHERIIINQHLEHGSLFENKTYGLTYGTMNYGCGSNQEKQQS